MKENISVQEALNEILSKTKPLKTEKVFLNEAVNRVLAEDIFSPFNIPPTDNSAMDGYAVRFEDTLNASFKKFTELKIVGEAPAGKIYNGELKKGETVKIMTGGALPRGANAVIRREDVEENFNSIKIFKPVKKGQDIRTQGEDINKGEMIMEKGMNLTPARIGLLASVNRSFVKVYRNPVVSVIVTGDEVAEIDEALTEGKIKNSNGFTLMSLLIEAGCIVRQTEVVKDTKIALKNAIIDNSDSDIVLSTGGVSMGDYDFVKDVVKESGYSPVFWKVRVKPGRPLFFAVKNSTLYFGIPGNPVSVMTTFYHFILPAIRKMQGFTNICLKEFSAILTEDIKRKSNRSEFVRGILTENNGEFFVSSAGSQGSGILSSMHRGNCFIVFNEGHGLSEKGERVVVEIFDKEFYFKPLV